MIIPAPAVNSIVFFGIEIKFYALFFLLGFALLYNILKRDLIKTGLLIDTNSLFNLAVATFIGAIVGARLYHVVTSFNLYYHENNFNLLKVINIKNGGLGLPGGILGGIVTGFCYAKIKKIREFAGLLALGLPNLLIAQSVGRLGNYFNQELYGKPGGILIKLEVESEFRPVAYLNENYFQPLFLYESILTLTAFLLYRLIFSKFPKGSEFKTFFIGYYFTSYGLIRVILEPMRIDESVMFLGQRLNWFVAISFIIVGFLLLVHSLISTFKIGKSR